MTPQKKNEPAKGAKKPKKIVKDLDLPDEDAEGVTGGLKSGFKYSSALKYK